MSKKPYIIGAILLLVIIIGGYCYYTHEQSRQNARELTLYGNVDLREVSVAFRQGDRIKEILVEEGDKVTAGDVLAKLDSRDIEFQILQLKAQILAQKNVVNKLHNGSRPEDISQASARVASAYANANLASANYTRQEALYQAGAISVQALDNARANRDATAATLSEATAALNELQNGYRSEDIAEGEAQLAALEASLARNDYLLSEYTLVAPADGVIRSRLLEPGDMAAAGSPVFRLSLNTQKWVRVYVQESSLGGIFEGQAARIVTDSNPDNPLIGQVGYISSSAEFTPKTVQTEELRSALVYEVRIYVDDAYNSLRMGMPVTVIIERAAKK